jgi:pilus assembly protein CpaC
VTTGSTQVQNTDGNSTEGVQSVGGLSLIQDAAAFGGLGAFFTVGDFLVGALIDTLESKGLVRTLAEPNLVALSGDSASFLAGGEVPIPFPDGDGDNINILFKPFGVGLSFTPTVVDEDLINLEMETEVSSVDPSLSVITNGNEVPGFNVRRARTTVELRDGQSIVIAGLLQEDFADNVAQIPWVGDIPVLGTLFRSSDFQRNQTELVIIATPVLVTAVDGNTLRLPTDRIRLPREDELFLLGKTEMPADIEQVASQSFEGPFGYIVE